jgi:phosphoglycerate dehydrogenase-like enzyme
MSDAVVAIGSQVNDEVRTATLDVLNDEARVVFLQDQPPAARAETLRDATVLIVTRVGGDVSPEELAQAKRLRLVQFLSAGVDGIDFTAIPPDVVITDNAGAYAKPMAEHAAAMALALAKRLPQRHAAGFPSTTVRLPHQGTPDVTRHPSW